MAVPNRVVEETARQIRNAESRYAGLIIWRMAKENCGHSTNSPQFEAYKRELAQLVGRRGGNKNAKRIRQQKAEQLKLEGIK